MLQNMIRIENAQKTSFLKIFSTMFNASSSEVRYYGFSNFPLDTFAFRLA